MYWAHISMLMGDLKCMEMLLKSDEAKSKKWQYVINQPGSALPVVPVQEIAYRLNHFKGNCDAIYSVNTSCHLDSIHSIWQPRLERRHLFKHKLT